MRTLFFLLLFTSSALAQTSPEGAPAATPAPAETPAPETAPPSGTTAAPIVAPATGAAPVPEAASNPAEIGASPAATEPKLPPKTEPASPPSSQQVPAPSGTKLDATEMRQTLTPPQTSSELLDSPLGMTESNISLDSRISLDLRDIGVMDILKFLAIKSNLNIVGGKGLSDNVSLLLNDVTVREALEIILSVSRLAFSIEGNIMRVMTEEEYKALYGKEFYDKRNTKIIRLKYASAKNVGAMLENTKSTVGRIIYDESTGTVVMIDTPQKIAEMEEIIRHEELPTIVRVPATSSEVFDLEYAVASKVSEKITPALTKELGKIYVDERGNRLIVSDMPHKIEEIRALVKAFDTKTREVFIEAKIVQISLSDRFQAGVDWASLSKGHFLQTFPLNLTSFGQMTVGSIAPQTTTNADGTTSTTFSGSGVILQFLETFGKVSVLSTPQIAVVDGEEAKIMVGTKEAYTTSSVTQSQATTTTAQQVTFVDVGVNLKVTPTISSGGFVTMKIRPEVSSVNRFITTAQGDQIPVVESTNAETKVMVRDGSTVLIGGLMTTQRRRNRSGIPILSRIPLLGIPFRSTTDESVNTELSVLLTPHIMSGDTALPGTRPAAVAEVTLPPAAGLAAPDTMKGPEPEATPEKKEEKKDQRKWKGR